MTLVLITTLKHINPPLVVLHFPAKKIVHVIWEPRNIATFTIEEREEQNAFEKELQVHFPENKIRDMRPYGELTTERWMKLEKDYRALVKEGECFVVYGHLKHLTYTGTHILATKDNLLSLHHLTKEQLEHLYKNPQKKEWLLDIVVNSVRENWNTDNLVGQHLQFKKRLQWSKHWDEILKMELQTLKEVKNIRKNLGLPPSKKWSEIDTKNHVEALALDFDSLNT